MSEKELKSRTEGNLHSISNGSRRCWAVSWGDAEIKIKNKNAEMLGKPRFPTATETERKQLWNYSCSFSKLPLKIDGWL